MVELGYGNLLAVCMVGALVPLVLGLLPRLRLPSVVLEIAAGMLLGPAVLEWVEVDEPVAVLSWLGLAFLLFLAGLEIDPVHLRGPLAGSAVAGYLVSLAVATPIAVGLTALGWVLDPALLVIVLSATALGLVVPVIRDAGASSGSFGQAVIVSATVADVAAVLLLSLLFGAHDGLGARSGVLVTFALVVLALTLAIVLARRWRRLRHVLVALQATTAQIRVRLAVVLLVGLTALASRFGLETILGAFLAGVVISLVDREGSRHPHFRPKLDALGFGLLVPVFYVATGLQLDVRGLVDDTSAVLRVPAFLLALLLVRGLPALLLVRALGWRRAAAAGLLQATSLPFIVAATQVGVTSGLMTTTTAAALVSAGILSVAVFPAAALALVRDSSGGRVQRSQPAPAEEPPRVIRRSSPHASP